MRGGLIQSILFACRTADELTGWSTWLAVIVIDYEAWPEAECKWSSGSLTCITDCNRRSLTGTCHTSSSRLEHRPPTVTSTNIWCSLCGRRLYSTWLISYTTSRLLNRQVRQVGGPYNGDTLHASLRKHMSSSRSMHCPPTCALVRSGFSERSLYVVVRPSVCRL